MSLLLDYEREPRPEEIAVADVTSARAGFLKVATELTANYLESIGAVDSELDAIDSLPEYNDALARWHEAEVRLSRLTSFEGPQD